MNELRTKRQREGTNVLTNPAFNTWMTAANERARSQHNSRARNPTKRYYSIRTAPSGRQQYTGFLSDQKKKTRMMQSWRLVYLRGGTEPKPNQWIISEFRQKQMLSTRCSKWGSIGVVLGALASLAPLGIHQRTGGGRGGRKLVRTVT